MSGLCPWNETTNRLVSMARRVIYEKRQDNISMNGGAVDSREMHVTQHEMETYLSDY